MTLTQLEYIVAIDAYNSFVMAAKHCEVAQPSLTMQVQKLEKELGFELFDRSSLPIVTLSKTKEILKAAKEILKQANYIYEVSKVDPKLRLNGKRAKNTEYLEKQEED